MLYRSINGDILERQEQHGWGVRVVDRLANLRREFVQAPPAQITWYAFVVMELKVGEFQPERAGKMDFYLSAIDDLLRQADDQPIIGMVLCKSKNKVVAEYAPQDLRKPCPKALHRSLPAVEELEADLKVDSTKWLARRSTHGRRW